jgi:hypothetical protein
MIEHDYRVNGLYIHCLAPLRGNGRDGKRYPMVTPNRSGLIRLELLTAPVYVGYGSN